MSAISTFGSRSFSPGTSIHVISLAPLVPGLQGGEEVVDSYVRVVPVWPGNCQEMCCSLNLSHWLHQCVPHHNRNICPTVPLCSLAKHPDVLLRQHVGGVPEVQLEQVRPGVLLRQVNVDPLLKPSSDGSVQMPRNIGCPQNKDPVCVVGPASVRGTPS